MLNRPNPFLCSTFLTDVIVLKLEIYGYAGLFFVKIIKLRYIFINLLLKDAHRTTVCVTFFLKGYINLQIAKEEVSNTLDVILTCSGYSYR